METQSGWALVIDGDDGAHSLYRQVLGDLGFAVEICDRGAQALVLLARRSYALLLIDPRTPGVSAVEILSQVYQHPASVIVVGDLAPEEWQGHPTEPADHRMLPKPFTADDLRSAVARQYGAPAGRQPAESALPRLYEQIAQIVKVLFRADRTSLMLCSADGDRAAVMASAGFPFATPGDTSAPLNDSVSGWVIRHAEPLLLGPDGDLPLDLQGAWRSDLFCSGICVPLVVRGRVLGALSATRRCDRLPFAAAERDGLMPLASQIAVAIENKRLQQQVQRHIHYFTSLNTLCAALLATLDVDRAIDIAVDHLRAMFPSVRGYLFLHGERSPWIDRLIAIGDTDAGTLDLDDVHATPGLVGQVLADAAPRLCRAADRSDELAAWERVLLAGGGATLLSVALKTDTALYGAIELASGPAPFGDEELHYMISFGSLVAQAIEKLQLYAAVARSEARYHELFQRAGDAVFVIDTATMAMVAANPAAEKMSGYSQAELMMVAPAHLIAPIVPGRSAVVLGDLCAEGTSEYEGVLRARSGYSVPVSICASEVAHGGAGYLLLVVRNISEHRRQAQRLAQSEKLAGMGRLTAAIAHEINNPLQALRNTLHLLLNRSFAEEKRERLLSMAQMEVDRMAALVQRMLELHRPSREDMRPVSVHGLLESALAGAGNNLQQHHVVVERDWAAKLLWVNGIGGHLKQVFQDLATNAVEAMPEGGRLLIRTRLEDGEDASAPPRVLVEFADDGPAIPDGEVHLIFEPFYTTRRSGSGLGLAISYGIVERHGGTLSVSSTGSGTTFRVSLPATMPEKGS